MNSPASLYHLANFADACFLPWTAPVRRRSPWPTISAAQAGRALEAVLWLRLGVSVNAFPESAATELLADVGNGLQQVLSSHDHVLRPLISRHYWDVLVRTLSGADSLGTDAALHRGAGVAGGAYASALSLRVNAWHSDSEDAAEIVTFGSEQVWRRAAGLPGLTLPRQHLESDRFLAGTVELLSNLLDLDRFAGDLLGDGGVNKAGAISIIGEVFSVQAWRLNLHVVSVRTAFRECVSAAANRLVAHTAVRADFWPQISLDLDLLTERWKEHAKLAEDAMFEPATA